MRNEINLTDEQIEESFGLEVCLGVDDIVFTRETFENLLDGRKNFAEPGRVAEHTDSKLVIERIQIAKGQPRTDLIVVDFGAVRGCYK